MSVRLSTSGSEWLDAMTAKYEVDATTVVRSALAVAAAHSREVEAILATIRRNG